MSTQTKHILVIRLSAMGDIAIAVPVINTLLDQNPDLQISVLTKANFKPIFKDLNGVDVITLDAKGEHKGLFGLMTLARQIKAINPDAIADLHSVLRTSILKRLLGGFTFKQIDKGRKEKKELVKGRSFNQLTPTYKRYEKVFHQLGISLNADELKLLTKAPVPDGFLSAFQTDRSTIGIAPLAAFEGKTYPKDLMRQLVKELSSQYQLFLFGGPEDASYLDDISTEGVINLAGKTSLETELDLISNLDLMISMDSGNAHLAAMYGVKVITLWGVTHPYAGFYPIGQPEEYGLMASREIYPKIPTSVYGNKWPDGYEDAMRTIPVQTIVDKVNEILF